jgi:hypothetical protein
LTLYGSTPAKFRDHFIRAFRSNPRALVGITKAHTIVHAIKMLDKHGLVVLAIPLVMLAMILASLPAAVLWSMLVITSCYLLFLTRSKSKVEEVSA